jgi:hypothetical protein
MTTLTFCLGFRDWHIKHLYRCLESIRRHTDEPIIVCDLASQTADIRYICAPLDVSLIRVLDASEWSRSWALNIAASTAPLKTTHFVFTDADMIFPGPWFSFAEKWIQSNPDSVGITRSRDLDANALQHLDQASDEWIFRNSVPHASDLGHGAAMVVPREWFEKVGGFDEFYVTWGAEDNDLTSRAEWDGRSVSWIPEAWVAHQWHRRDWPTHAQFMQVHKNRQYYSERLRERGPIIRNGPVSFPSRSRSRS